MKAVEIRPGEIIKRNEELLHGLYLILEGELTVYEFNSKKQPVVLNKYSKGMVICDPEFN